MKNIIVLLSILIVVSTTAQDIPDCPDGWTTMVESNVDFVVDDNPLTICNLDIYYCIKEDVNGNISLRLRASHIIDKTCLEGYEIDDEFWNNMYETLLLRLNDKGIITINSCADPSTIIQMLKKTCWTYEHSTFNAPGGDFEAWLLPCEESVGFCAIQMEICYDYNFTPPRLTYVSILELGEYVVQCEGNGFVIPSLGPVEFQSTCFSACGFYLNQ